MAIQKPQGAQLDIQDIAAEIAADPTAINDIAVGLTSGSPNPATTSFDEYYVRNDGGNYAGITDGEVLVFTSGSPDGFVNRLLVESDISDLQSYLLPTDIGTGVQAWSDYLDAIGFLTPMMGDVMVFEGSPLSISSRALEKGDISDFVENDYVLKSPGSPDLQTIDGDLTVNGTIIGYNDNATSIRMRGPQSVGEGGADVQSYLGIFYNPAFAGTGNLETRAVFGGNVEMDVEIQAPRQLRLSAVDNSQVDGQIWASSRTNMVFNMRTDAETASPNQLIVDRASTGTTGVANTSDVDISVNTGKLQVSSPVMFTDVPELPQYTVGTLPAVVLGGMIYVTDATRQAEGSPNTGTGVMCFGDASDWIDVTTGEPVA